jgi:hypothetical protein
VGRFELAEVFEKFCPWLKWSVEDSESADIAMREEYPDTPLEDESFIHYLY